MATRQAYLCCHLEVERRLCHRSVQAAAASSPARRDLACGAEVCGSLARVVSRLWERLLEEKTLSDVAALNEPMCLTWFSNQYLNKGIQLPSSLQSLTFEGRFNQSLEGVQLPSSLQSLAFGGRFNAQLGERPTTQQPAEFDVWRWVQPEPGGHPTTQQPAEF